MRYSKRRPSCSACRISSSRAGISSRTFSRGCWPGRTRSCCAPCSRTCSATPGSSPRKHETARIEVGADGRRTASAPSSCATTAPASTWRYADKLFGAFQRLHSPRRVRGHRHRPGHRAAHRAPPRRRGVGRGRGREGRHLLLHAGAAGRRTDGRRARRRRSRRRAASPRPRSASATSGSPRRARPDHRETAARMRSTSAPSVTA